MVIVDPDMVVFGWKEAKMPRSEQFVYLEEGGMYRHTDHGGVMIVTLVDDHKITAFGQDWYEDEGPEVIEFEIGCPFHAHLECLGEMP